MTSDLDLHPDLTPAPATLFASPDPAAVVAQATRIAQSIGPVIHRQQLVKRIGQSDHVFLEGWTLAGTMLGVFPITVSSGPLFTTEGGVYGYQATVEARTMAGAVVGRADAECTRDENEKWEKAPSFQLRSMAITRASSKALRMPLGFVMKLAGYDATPAEEMEAAAARGGTVSGGKGVAPGWRDINEQQRAHADLGVLIDEHGLRNWVEEYLESKGYQRPLAKGQLNQLRRAIERELEARRKQSDLGSSGPTGVAGDAAPVSSPGSDPRPPTPTPPPEASTGAGRGEVEGGDANHGRTGAAEAPPPPDAASPPDPHSPGGSGGTKAARPARGTGKLPAGRAPTDPEQAELAAYEQRMAGDDPGRFAR
jgi:hypothetical protein